MRPVAEAVRPHRTGGEAAHRNHGHGGEDHPPPAGDRPPEPGASPATSPTRLPAGFWSWTRSRWWTCR
jgi:hypothetical protein